MEHQKYLNALLEARGESSEADYKTAVTFQEDSDFSKKLVKHILGFANNGGGYILIGFVDETLAVDQKLDEAVVKSYDTTRLGQYVQSFASLEEKIRLNVYKLNKWEKVFPIIQIFSFEKYPFFCTKNALSDSGKEILKNGAIYYRDEIARTSLIIDHKNFSKIIDRAVRNRQGEMLLQFKDLLDRISPENKSKVDKPASDLDWIVEAKKRSFEGLSE